MSGEDFHLERQQDSRHGLSLVEVAVSTVLVGFMLVATLDGVGAVFRTRGELRQRHFTYTLAQDLMSEILQSCYEDPGGSPAFGLEAGEIDTSRTTWDDLDDYDNLMESRPKTRAGTPIPNTGGWEREVQIDPVEIASPDTVALGDTGLRRITVTVRTPSGTTLALQGWRSRWGLLEMKPPISATYVTRVKADLRLGDGTTVVPGSSIVANSAEGP